MKSIGNTVGLVGWRGMVGSVLMDRMQAEGDFDLIEPIFFSTSNAGGKAPAMAKNEKTLKDVRLGGKYYDGYLYGSTIAAPIWKTIMDDALLRRIADAARARVLAEAGDALAGSATDPQALARSEGAGGHNVGAEAARTAVEMSRFGDRARVSAGGRSR